MRLQHYANAQKSDKRDQVKAKHHQPNTHNYFHDTNKGKKVIKSQQTLTPILLALRGLLSVIFMCMETNKVFVALDQNLF